MDRTRAALIALVAVIVLATTGVVMAHEHENEGNVGYYPAGFVPPGAGTPWPSPHPLPTAPTRLAIPPATAVIRR